MWNEYRMDMLNDFENKIFWFYILKAKYDRNIFKTQNNKNLMNLYVIFNYFVFPDTYKFKEKTS